MIKKEYIEPSVKAVEIKWNQILASSISSFDGNQVSEQPGEGTPTVNGMDGEFEDDFDTDF